MTMVGFYSKEKADKLQAFGFNYVINKVDGNRCDYLFLLTDGIIEKLNENFEAYDYYLTNTNRLLF